MRYAVLVAMLVAGCGSGDNAQGVDAAAAGCSKDTDCKSDRICVSGECVDVIADLAAPVADAPAPIGCGKDADCKGDRICVAGACVDPARPDSGAAPDLVPAVDLAGIVDLTALDAMSPPDFVMNMDFSLPPDIAPPDDQSVPPDLAPPIDFKAAPDLKVLPDLSVCPTNVLNCGGCGIVCMVPHAVPACATTDMQGMPIAPRCVVANCLGSFIDCNRDGNNANNDGCEIDVSNDVNNCDGCGKVCSFRHAGASCVNRACQLGACSPPWGDCDHVAADGCEIDLMFGNDPNNCGACGKSCQIGEYCSMGACAPSMCMAPWQDCARNGQGNANLLTDNNNCGSCGNACMGGAHCDCGGNCVNFAIDPTNCGGCGVRCDNGNCCTDQWTGKGACFPIAVNDVVCGGGIGCVGGKKCAQVMQGLGFCVPPAQCN